MSFERMAEVSIGSARCGCSSELHGSELLVSNGVNAAIASRDARWPSCTDM